MLQIGNNIREDLIEMRDANALFTRRLDELV